MPNIIKIEKLQFVDEPPPKGVPGRKRQTDPYRPVFEALAQHPNKWSLVATGEKLYVAQRLREQFPDFEITTRAEQEGVPSAKSPQAVWACYRGSQYFLDRAEERRAKSADEP